MKQSPLDNRTKIISSSGDQFVTIFKNFSAVIAGATSTSDFTRRDGILQGSIHIHVSSTFVGTTATIALLGSNDNVNFGTVFQNDGTTPVSFTLAANDNKFADLQRALYKYYRVLYTKGDASAGTIDANYVGVGF